MWRGSTAGAPGSASCESAGGVQRIVGLVAQPPRSSLPARLARRARSRSQARPKNPLCQPESDCDFLTPPAFLFAFGPPLCVAASPLIDSVLKEGRCALKAEWQRRRHKKAWTVYDAAREFAWQAAV